MRVILGLGGNVGDVPAAFSGALEGLAEMHAIQALSALYRSAPVGPPQPRFWNMAAVLELRTSLTALLDLCQELEEAEEDLMGEELDVTSIEQILRGRGAPGDVDVHRNAPFQSLYRRVGQRTRPCAERHLR